MVHCILDFAHFLQVQPQHPSVEGAFIRLVKGTEYDALE